MDLRALIVDDEEFARKNLIMLLQEFCPTVEVVGEASSKEEAKDRIALVQPNVLFLDIRMPSGVEGFELLDELGNQNMIVVFVTAFKDFAIRAFNANAAYYLLKPIDIEELITAVARVGTSLKLFADEPEQFKTYNESMTILTENLKRNSFSGRITISHTKGLKIVEESAISHLEASGNCTTIYFKDGGRYLDTRTLKVYEQLLNPEKFIRVHKSHIINLDLLTEYLNEDGHFAVLKSGIRIPVARNRVTDFVRMLKEF